MSSDKDNLAPAIGLPDPDSDPTHARLRAALGETGAAFAPRAGWERAVWARIDASSAGRPAASPRWGWFASGAMLAAAAIALLVWQPWHASTGRRDGAVAAAAATDRVAMGPSISFRKGAEIMRGTTAAPGDTMIVRHDVPAAAVWIYFEDTLVTEGGATVELRLDRPGTYHVVTSTSAGRAPATLDAALASLVTAGAEHRRTRIDVR